MGVTHARSDGLAIAEQADRQHAPSTWGVLEGMERALITPQRYAAKVVTLVFLESGSSSSRKCRSLPSSAMGRVIAAQSVADASCWLPRIRVSELGWSNPRRSGDHPQNVQDVLVLVRRMRRGFITLARNVEAGQGQRLHSGQGSSSR